jgi:hypothetical protein
LIKHHHHHHHHYSHQKHHQLLCYDSDPEQEYLGRRRRLSSLMSGQRLSKFRRFGSSVSSLNIGAVGAGDDDTAASDYGNHNNRSTTTASSSVVSDYGDDEDNDNSTSYQTARHTMEPTEEEAAAASEVVQAPQVPLAPRHGDRISFDFAATDEQRKQCCGEPTTEGDEPPYRLSSEEDKARQEARASVTPPAEPSGAYHQTNMSSCGDSTSSSTIHASSAASTDTSFTEHQVQQRQHGLHHHHQQQQQQQQQVHMPLPARCEPPYFQSPTHWTEFHLLYSSMDGFTKAHVQELSNVRFPMVWHPPTNTKKTAPGMADRVSMTPSPVAVHGVFEVGAHLDNMVVQPKFTWSPVLQPNLEEGRKILLSGSQPHSVELLSIIRVNKPSPTTAPSITGSGWDRSRYPFCRLDRTLCVTTNDLAHPYLVFEARSPSERDWLVVALKLIVARLASIIIVRDEDMLLEFFSPYSALMELEDDEDECCDRRRHHHDGGHDRHHGDATPNRKVSPRTALESINVGKEPLKNLQVTGGATDNETEEDASQYVTTDDEEDYEDDDDDGDL